MDDSKARRAVTLGAGRMTVEGVSDIFFQGLGRRLRLEADTLELADGVALREGALVGTPRILASARPVQDSLRRVGFKGEAGEIALILRPLPAGAEPRLLLTLTARDDSESGLDAELLAPAAVFESLRRDILSGAARTLTLAASTSLWVREAERDAGPSLPVAWHLGLEPDGRTSTPARGLVETLDWTSVPAPVAPPPATDPEDDPPETTADALGKLNWSLRQLLLVLVFLMIIVALK